MQEIVYSKAEPDGPAEPQWTVQRFVDKLVAEQPVQTEALIDAAIESGLSQRQAKRWLRKAEAAGLIYGWSYGANRPVEFATVPQNQLAT